MRVTAGVANFPSFLIKVYSFCIYTVLPPTPPGIKIVVVVIIIIIIIILVITFMQDIYNYMPETNHVSRVYSIAAVLYSQFVLHVMLFHP